VCLCVCMYVVYTSDYYLARTVYTKGTGRSEAHDMVTVTELQIVRETIWYKNCHVLHIVHALNDV